MAGASGHGNGEASTPQVREERLAQALPGPGQMHPRRAGQGLEDRPARSPEAEVRHRFPLSHGVVGDADNVGLGAASMPTRGAGGKRSTVFQWPAMPT